MKIMILLIVTLFLVSGCDLEDTIEDLTSRDMTVTQTIYDGTTERSQRTAVLAENFVVTAGDSKQASVVDLDETTDNIVCYSNNVDPAEVYISAKISALSSKDVSLDIYLVDLETEDKSMIGSLYVPGGQSEIISKNTGFNNSTDSVKQKLYDFFSQHPSISSTRLLVKASGNSGASAQVEWMDLETSPAYRDVQQIGSSLLESYSDNIKSIGKVSMSGSIENLGEEEFRFLLVVGDNEGGVNFSESGIADGYIQPGESIGINDLLVENGLARLKGAIKQALDGHILEGNIFLLSTHKIEADINKLKIKTRITVGL